jgi:hypothetical protein
MTIACCLRCIRLSIANPLTQGHEVTPPVWPRSRKVIDETTGTFLEQDKRF